MNANQDESHLHETVLNIEDASLPNITSTSATTTIAKLDKLEAQFRAFTLHYQLA